MPASQVLEYANGASGTFITTTGEAPGTNRLEIVGTKGRLVAEAGGVPTPDNPSGGGKGSLILTKNKTPSDAALRGEGEIGPPEYSVVVRGYRWRMTGAHIHNCDGPPIILYAIAGCWRA